MPTLNDIETEECCEYPMVDICDVVSTLPLQYQKSENFHKIIQVFVNQINCMYSALNAGCQLIDCSQLEGDGLTSYGESIGFPRCQCDLHCSGSGVQCIEDDEIYCRLIKAYLISRQGANMRNLCLALDCLFGQDAFIISSNAGLTQVSSGRPLTNEELCLLKVFKRVLPKSPATSIEIYDISDFSQIIGANCGSCNIYAETCSGAETLCNPLTCEDCVE